MKDGSSNGHPSHVTLRYSDDAAVAPALVLALRELDALEPGTIRAPGPVSCSTRFRTRLAGWRTRRTAAAKPSRTGARVQGANPRRVHRRGVAHATHRALRALMRAGGVDDTGWIVYDCVEMIVPISQNADVSSRSRRAAGTEGARILLGSDAVDVLGSMRVTLAGAGGIGREVLRLLALAGLAYAAAVG